MSSPALHLFVANVGAGGNNNNTGGGGNNDGQFTLTKLGPGGELVTLQMWVAGNTWGQITNGGIVPFGTPFNVSFTTNNLTDVTTMVMLVVAPVMNGSPGNPMAITGQIPASSQQFMSVMLPSNVSQWTNNGMQQFAFGIVSCIALSGVLMCPHAYRVVCV